MNTVSLTKCGQPCESYSFCTPGKIWQGVLVTPTVHGNLLIGPTAQDIENKEGTNTTRDGLDQVLIKSSNSVRNIPTRQVITSFAGLRAHEDGDDFIIGETEKDFIDCAGIESPGLSSAPAIGEMVADILKKKYDLKEKVNFVSTRKGIADLNAMSLEERNEYIRRNPAYGNIICRCEMVSEGEIIDAIKRPVGARSLDGVKRRTRAGWDDVRQASVHREQWKFLRENLKLQLEKLQNVAEIPESLKA